MEQGETQIARFRPESGRRVGAVSSRSAIQWPVPPDWDEDEEPVREVDHTGDDPGPEDLDGAEMIPLHGSPA